MNITTFLNYVRSLRRDPLKRVYHQLEKELEADRKFSQDLYVKTQESRAKILEIRQKGAAAQAKAYAKYWD